jgi:hypothetical protein
MSKNLEPAFHAAMVGIYEMAKAECYYNATRFLQLVNEHGGLHAARTLLHSGGFSDGLTRLWQEGRLDISMEALVLKDPWRSLFTTEELAIADKRLRDLGYAVK